MNNKKKKENGGKRKGGRRDLKEVRAYERGQACAQADHDALSVIR